MTGCQIARLPNCQTARGSISFESSAQRPQSRADSQDHLILDCQLYFVGR